MRSYSELVEILREREFELFTIRRNFDELSAKFSQLEKAFAINLRVHRTLENELAICKLGKNPNEPILKEDLKGNFAADNADETSKTRTELYSSLTRVLMEKERCEEALRYQKKVAERQKHEYEQSIDTIQEECKSILQHCREFGEKQFRELLKIYKNGIEKVRITEKKLKASRAQECLTRERIFQVANIFESLQRIKDVRIQALCEHGTSVLRTLANGSENLCAESIKKLREFTWDEKDDTENQSLEFLQRQNSVLCHVVKNLKRKANFEESFKNEECTNKIETGNNVDEESVIRRVVEERNYEKPMNNKKKNAIVEQSSSSLKTAEAVMPMHAKTQLSDEAMNEKNGIVPICGNINRQMEESIRIEAFESHKNGIRYEEYTFHLFNERKLRVRHSNDVGMKSQTLVIEFVDTEKKFLEAPIERTVFFLGENVREIVNFSKSVMHCGVQTERKKFYEKFVQTTITGSNGFFRSNAGVTMLNSEKRAIERSLKYLERTVASLKGSILDQARSMIGSDVKHLGNEFFDCIHRLEK